MTDRERFEESDRIRTLIEERARMIEERDLLREQAEDDACEIMALRQVEQAARTHVSRTRAHAPTLRHALAALDALRARKG